MTIALFRSLSSILDALVPTVDEDLPLADDIHPAIRKIGDYAADLIRLPDELAKFEAQKASAEAALPGRDEAIRKLQHPVRMLEAKLKKLGESIDRNRAALTDEDEKPAAAAPSSLFPGLVLPTRKDIIESLRTDMLAAEDEIAKARDALKKAEQTRKGFVTRAANLAKRIDETKKAIADHAGRLEETNKLLRKTINHLRNRQQNRDRKRAKTSAAPGIESSDGPSIEFVDAAHEAPKGPTDEDIRKMAASEGLTIDTPADLEAARQLFLN